MNTIDQALADIAHASKGIASEAIAWEKERAELLARIDALTTPPVVVPPEPVKPTRGPRIPLKPLKLPKPFGGKFTEAGWRIDAALSRVIAPMAGVSQTLRDFAVDNLNDTEESFVEKTVLFAPGGATEPYRLTLENGAIAQTSRYGIFIAAGWNAPGYPPVTDRTLVYVTLRGMIIVSAEQEHPVRFEDGVEALVDNCSLSDTVDLYSNKANSVLRIDCRKFVMRDTDVRGLTKFEKNLGSAEVYNTHFVGAIQIECPRDRVRFVGCTLNGKAI